LCLEGDLSTNLFSNTNSDPNTKTNRDVKLGTSRDASLALENYLDPNLDSKAKEILKDIT
jgi:hypothetical protein